MESAATLVLPGRFRAVVFDVDGLLVPTEQAWAAAEAELLTSRGQAFTDADRVATIGRSVDESIAIYAARIGLPEAGLASLRSELVDRFLARVPSLVAAPGARSVVLELERLVPLAVASSSPQLIVETVLASTGLAEGFRVMVTGDDVTRHKPAPDPYLLACRRLGVEPRDAVALEDSEPGIRSAVTAGLWCVAVPSDPAVDTREADLVLRSLNAVEVRAPDVRDR